MLSELFDLRLKLFALGIQCEAEGRSGGISDTLGGGLDCAARQQHDSARRDFSSQSFPAGEKQIIVARFKDITEKGFNGI